MNIALHSVTSSSSMQSPFPLAKGDAASGDFHQALHTSMHAAAPVPAGSPKKASTSAAAMAAGQARSGKLDTPAKFEDHAKPRKSITPGDQESTQQSGGSLANPLPSLAFLPVPLVAYAAQPLPAEAAAGLPSGTGSLDTGLIAPGSVTGQLSGNAAAPAQTPQVLSSAATATLPAVGANAAAAEQAGLAIQAGLASQAGLAFQPAPAASSAKVNEATASLASAVHPSAAPPSATNAQGNVSAQTPIPQTPIPQAPIPQAPATLPPASSPATALETFAAQGHAVAVSGHPAPHAASSADSNTPLANAAGANSASLIHQAADANTAGGSTQGQGSGQDGKSGGSAAGVHGEKSGGQTFGGEGGNSAAAPVLEATAGSVAAVNNSAMQMAAPSPPMTGENASQAGSGMAASPSANPLPLSTHAPALAEPAINSARVLASMSGSEMRVGMHSAEFGSISIATTVSASGLAAQIALDHGALGRALAAHLPSIEEKLGNALGVTARVEVRASSGGFGSSGNPETAGRDASSGSSARDSRSANGFVPNVPRAADGAYGIAPSDAAGRATGSARLSVLA